MNRLLIASVFVLLCAGAAFGQQHAPTLDVCQADVALWYSMESATDYLNQETKHINEGVRNTSPYNRLPVEEVEARVKEMGDCAIVVNFRDERYHEAQTFYSGILHDRMANFIYRHNLMEQLKKEDAVGIR